MNSTRRFCGSVTPSGVGMRGRVSPYQVTSIASAGTPILVSSAAAFFARRSDSYRLKSAAPDVSAWPASTILAEPPS